MDTKKILLVDDDPDHLALVGRYTESLGLSFRLAASGNEAVQLLREEAFGVVMTDMVMPGMDGMELLLHSRQEHPEVAVIVMTGFSKNYSYVDVIKAGASDFIVKPFKRDEYHAKLNRLFAERALLADLRQAKEKAELADKAKTELLHTISHEFRTPMNGIMGFTELLLDMELPKQQREFLEMIDESAKRLMDLLNQLLDFTRLASGGKDLHLEEFTLPSFFDAILPALEQKAKAKGLPLRLAIYHSLHDKVLFGDTMVLGQILNHLVDNAVKFSEQGEITIEVVAYEASLPDSILLQFNVTDTGCGIAEAHKEQIFAPFSQVEDYLTRRHEGAGLGLALCIKLVRLLSGRIWVESDEGYGSIFSFTARFSMANSIEIP